MFSPLPEDRESEEEWENDSSIEEVDQWITPLAQWYSPGSEGLRYSLQRGFPIEEKSEKPTPWAFRATAAVADPESNLAPNIAGCKAILIKPELMHDRSVDFITVIRLGEESLKDATRILLVPSTGRMKEDCRRNGIWGADHDEPWILCFERIFVDESLRIQGLGRRMFHQVMDDVLTRARKAGKPVLAITMPAGMKKEFQGRMALKSLGERRQIQKASLAATRQFWRSLGFTRIGETMFFGWTRQVVLGPYQPITVRSEDLAEDEAIDERQGHLADLAGLWC